MATKVKIDRRRKYYLILDCETATLPYANNFSGMVKQKISIAKPLIYDLGWKVIDRQGRVYSKKSYLITEIFSVPQVFNTAYYCEKRPIYIDRLKKNETMLINWETAIAELEYDLSYTECVGAYNSMFDFKKAIKFTEEYINALYSDNYYEWENRQNNICDYIVNNPRKHKDETDFDPMNFNFRGKDYPLFDIWALSCIHLLDNDEYRQKCIEQEWLTASRKYYKTSAETAYRFLFNNDEFIESHTAIDDVEIECEIFQRILAKTKFKFEMGIIYFPFKIVGQVPFEIVEGLV